MHDHAHHGNAEKVALGSVAVASVVTAAKVLVGMNTGSLAILAEAAHSSLDLVASVITFFAVRYARMPADEDHAYGHGKLENIAGLGEAILLVATCVLLIREAVMRMAGEHHLAETSVWMFAVLALSITVDYNRVRILRRTAREERSMALEADALHFASDAWTSAVALVGIARVAAGVPSADTITGILVSLAVIVLAVKLGKRAIDELVDRTPHGVAERVRAIALATPLVESITNVRVRNSGSSTFIDCAISIPRHLSFHAAHTIVHAVEAAIKKEMPYADIHIHADPLVSPSETIADKVRMAVVPLGLRIHDVEIHLIDNFYHVDLHLDSDPALTFRSAHEASEEIRRRVRQEIPNAHEIFVHIDSARELYTRTDNVTPHEEEIVEIVREAVRTDRSARSVDSIIIMNNGSRDALEVNATVRFPDNLQLAEVDQATREIELAIRMRSHRIAKVILHAEPESVTLNAH